MKKEAYLNLLEELTRLQDVTNRLAGVVSDSEKPSRLDHISKIVNRTANTLADYAEMFDR